MSFNLGSQGVVVATAMAVSGTVILLALHLQKSQFSSSASSGRVLRSCISSASEDKKVEKKKKKKRVQFAEDVADPSGDGQVFRRSSTSRKTKAGAMPANRLALYNGMLRDRVVHRVGYSF